MSDHTRPTADDLQNNLKQTLAEIESPESEITDTADTETDGAESTDSQEITSDDSPEVTATEETEETQEVNEPQEKAATEEETQEPEVDYRKKFTESSREALVQTAQVKELEKVIDGSVETPEPTEQELRAEYPEWDDMTVTEQKLAKKTLWNDKRFSIIEQAREERKNVQAWNDKVDQFVDDPVNLTTYPELEGKTEEFRVFASKPTRRGLNFDDLVLAFNGELAKSRVKHTGKMFETGGNASKEKMQPKSDKLSIEEGRKLMETNFDEYKRLLRQGKIEMLPAWG